MNRTILRTILIQSLLIGAIAYTATICLVLLIPHLPLSNKRTFKSLMRVELTRERSERLAGAGNSLLLVLGSSVAEHGVSEFGLDSILDRDHSRMRCCNAATSGMFARANITNLREMLASGIRPERIVYGFFVQELNGKSTIHDNYVDAEAEKDGLKPRTLFNLLRFAPSTLSILLNPSSFRTYIYLVNNAFREVDDLTPIQRVLLGTNAVEKDSSFSVDATYLQDFEELIDVCRERHIPLALFNTPLRPSTKSWRDLPYRHTSEAYLAIEHLAMNANLPIWNSDIPARYLDSDFRDNYHLRGRGARKLGAWLGKRVVEWDHGLIQQDVLDSTALLETCTSDAISRKVTQLVEPKIEP